MLASTSYQSPLASAGLQQPTRSKSASAGSGSTSRRAMAMPSNSQQTLAVPSRNDILNAVDDADSAKNWDEDRVCDWLLTINCAHYEKLFRANNINGENLLEMDKATLQDMGIDKIGDRVRLFVSIKKLRTKSYANQKKRNRDSFAVLEKPPVYPPSASPRRFNSTGHSTTRKPSTKQHQAHGLDPLQEEDLPKLSARAHSPQLEEIKVARQQRFNVISPQEIQRREQNPAGYFHTNLAASNSQPSPQPATPHDKDPPTPTRAAGSHSRGAGSIDGSLMSSLPENQDMIRVIAKDGLTKVVKVTDCKDADEVMRLTLRKFGYREDHDRNYCFWTLAGVEPNPAACRRLYEEELWRVVKDPKRPERNRLILKKIHAGEPSEMELSRAADIAVEESAQAQQQQARTNDPSGKRSQLKAQKVLGETWDPELQYPLQPASYSSNPSQAERERNVYNAAKDLERPAEPSSKRPRARNDILRQFFGQRPPSELIASDLTTYFPNHAKEDIDKTARLSLRRSKRLSRVNSRLSVASNLSTASSLRDAPPMPRIEDTWLQNDASVPKLRLPDRGPSMYRDSIASSVLETLQEESAEPNRKSYVSFDSGSDSHTDAVNVIDPEGNVVPHSYSDDSSTKGDSARDISQVLNEDGEEADDELRSFLGGDSWDDSKWMKGALIGQGSFGCVYLALHTITGELLAVKQVETPSPGVASVNDQKKRSMIEALKREIGLLRELQHPNIVQYLGCSSSADYLNIFLEYVPGGSVQTMLNSYGALREPLVRSFVRQIVTGLAYLHKRDIVHRDIKGANILVDNKGGIKISDFGISKKMEASNVLGGGAATNKNRPSLQGSVFWMAPEVVKQTKYTRKSDVWSLGCLVVEMMTGNHPYPDCSQLQAIFKIGGSKACPSIPEEASEDAKHFLAQTFEIDDRDRPDAEQLLLSPFLNPCT